MSLTRKRAKAEPQGESFEYTEAVAVEGFATFRHAPVQRGAIFPIDYWVVAQHPQYFRALGPRPDGRSYPGPRRRGRCPECARAYERSKGSAHQRGYSQKHRKNAARVIAAHPWCVDCGATDDLCADHIVPLSKGGTNSLDNYAVRCRSCNSARANVERRRQAVTPPGEVSDRGRVSPRPGHRFSRNTLE